MKSGFIIGILENSGFDVEGTTFNSANKILHSSVIKLNTYSIVAFLIYSTNAF